MSSDTQKILTTDGIPLEESLKKAEKKNKIKAFLLVCPLLFFLIITYVFPIGDMLFRSVDDRMVTNMLPKTYKAMEKWNGKWKFYASTISSGAVSFLVRDWLLGLLSSVIMISPGVSGGAVASASPHCSS